LHLFGGRGHDDSVGQGSKKKDLEREKRGKPSSKKAEPSREGLFYFEKKVSLRACAGENGRQSAKKGQLPFKYMRGGRGRRARRRTRSI